MPTPPDSTPPPSEIDDYAGLVDDRVDFDRTRSEIMHRLFGAPRTVTRLGRFEVVGSAGAGEMGRVYIAFDPQLDRTVAIKVVRDDRGDAEQSRRRHDRLDREARALAKVSDRNVIAVHEVGSRDGELFIVMEYVAGPDLRAWLRAKSRSEEDILHVLTGAARGLAAAHRAGLVHRDFKPENMVVGEDLRAVVLDFGLARSADGERASETAGDYPSHSLGSDQVTKTGAAVGTPAYMAPEQMRGGIPDARSDQFAFCVTAWEAFTGQRPYHDWQAPLPPEGPVLMRREADREPPARIKHCLERGFSLDPEQRWASMDELLLHLLPERASGARPWMLVGAVGVLVAGIAFGTQRDDPAQCDAAGHPFDASWDLERANEVRGTIEGLDAPYAEDAANRVIEALDDYASAWRTAAVTMCESSRAGERYGRNLDRGQACLERRRSRFDAVVGILEQADEAMAAKVTSMVSALPEVETCLDDAYLLAEVEPPAESSERERVSELRAGLDTAAAQRSAGRPREALETAKGVRDQAESLDYPPVLAEAEAVVASALEATGDPQAAAESYETAYFVAGQSGHFQIAARAAAELVDLYGTSLSKPELARTWARHARMSLARVHDPARGLARLSRYEAATAALAGDDEAAPRLAAEAMELVEEAFGPTHLETSHSFTLVGVIHARAGKRDEGRRYFERALEIQRLRLPPQHPVIAKTLNNLGVSAMDRDDIEAATAYLEEALAIKQAVHGPDHPSLAGAYGTMASLAHMRAEWGEAVRLRETALAGLQRAYEGNHPKVADGLANMADALLYAERPEEAMDFARRALDMRQQLESPRSDTLAQDHMLVAKAARALGDGKLALAEDERGREVADAIGDDNPASFRARAGLGEDHLLLSDPRAALVVLEEAAALAERVELYPPTRAWFELQLARALDQTGKDPERARALADGAIEPIRSTGDSFETRAAERWYREISG